VTGLVVDLPDTDRTVCLSQQIALRSVEPVPQFRAVGAETNDLLSPGHSLVAFGSAGSGESGVITQYEMGGSGIFSVYTSAFIKPSLEQFIGHLPGGKFTHVIDHSVMPDVTGAVKLALVAGNSYLLKTDDSGGWRVVHS